ncbi:hypothetical protein ACHAWF_004974 [Thalassiosira exigua]
MIVIAGRRLWMSVVLMCLGSAVVSWHQKRFLAGWQLDDTSTSSDDDFSPLENKGRWRSAWLRPWDRWVRPDVPSGTAAFREPKAGTIKSISLLGERNSGTTWMYGHLGVCFNYTIPVLRSMTRYKHWFQYDDAAKIPNHTLAIAMFRDPMQWTRAMKSVPHHAPAHQNLPWYEFVTKEWTMHRLYKDEIYQERHLHFNNATGRICQERFHYHEIVSCLTRPYPEGYWGTVRKHSFSSHQPMYEMRLNDPKGTPYSNILEMRADKIRNFIDAATFSNVEGFWYYQYEQLLKEGTEQLVQKIERATGLKRHPQKCNIFEPQNRPKRSIDEDFVRYMTDRVDWNAEALIGYEKPLQSIEEQYL